MNRRILLGIAAVAVLAAVALFAIPKLGQQSDTDVRIGVNAPLTGPIAAWSGEYGHGFQMGIEEAAREYNVDPAVFNVDIQDNQGRPEQAVSILNRQRISPLDAYVSVATGPANAVAPQLDEMGVPHFIESFDAFITRGSPTRFRIMANSKAEAPLIVEYARRRNVRRLHIIQINLAQANEMVTDLIMPPLQQAGVTITREQFEMDQRDFNVVAQHARAQNADLIFIVGYSFHLQPMIRDLRALGLVQPGRVITTMDFVDLIYADVPREELANVVFDAPLFEIPGRVPRAEEWRQRYRERFNTTPTYVPAYAYDTATLIVRAYAQRGAVNAQSLTAAAPFDGVNGHIELDADRDIRVTGALATLDAQGRIVVVGE